MADALSAVRNGSYVEPAKQTLAVFFDDWIEGASTRLRPATTDGYRRMFDRYVRGRLGGVRLQAVTPVQLDRLYGLLLKEGGHGGGPISAMTVAHVHALLHKVLSDAARKGLVLRNAAQTASPPKPTRPELGIWSGEEMARFVRSVKSDRLAALWRLYCVTGCRRGEALAMLWEDLDLDAGRWEIRRALGVVNGAPVVMPTKSGRGRNVALDAGTVAALRAHRVQQAEERLALGPAYSDLGLVFCREDGRSLHPNVITRTFYRLYDAADLPRIRLHDVRHSAVTEMLRAGVPVKVVSERVGHASTSFTQDVYASVLPGMQADAANRIAEAIDRLR